MFLAVNQVFWTADLSQHSQHAEYYRSLSYDSSIANMLRLPSAFSFVQAQTGPGHFRERRATTENWQGLGNAPRKAQGAAPQSKVPRLMERSRSWRKALCAAVRE